LLVNLIRELAKKGVEEGHLIESYTRPLDNRNFKPSNMDDDDDELNLEKKPIS
jgi:hypothetical protein